MKKLQGAALIFIGSIFLYIFGVIGTIGARELIDGGNHSIFLPFQALGNSYPEDVFLMIAGLCTTFWGIYLLFARERVMLAPAQNGDEKGIDGEKRAATVKVIPSGATMTVSRYFVVNSFLLIFCEWIAYVGARANADERAVAVFAVTAIAQLLCGLLLLLMAIRDKQRSMPAIVIGGGLYAVGVAAAVFTVMWGYT